MSEPVVERGRADADGGNRASGGHDHDGDDRTGGGNGAGGVTVFDERRTDRWRGLAGATVATVVLAVLARSAGLLLVAALGATAVAYARVATPPPVAVAIDREFVPVEPGVGEPVTVTCTVENVGERTIADLRLADGVPDGVRITDGGARIATALRPGRATTIEYEVAGGTARAAFSPATVAVRDVAGLVERRAHVAAGEDAIAWPSLRPEAALSLLPRPLGPVGPLSTGEGGEGLAFHSVREYRPGDPLRRIDWHRRAKTGDLATVQFERERSASVVVVVDARSAAALAPGPDAPTAIERGGAAAVALVDGITDAGHRVGLATLGPIECWVAPGRGVAHRERLQRQLAAEGGIASRATAAASGARDAGPVAGDVEHDGGRHEHDGAADGDDRRGSPALAATDGGIAGLAALLARLDRHDSVVLVSPLCDDGSDGVVRRLAAACGALSVLSPDPTAADSPGRRLVRLERRERLRSLRVAGVDLVDWPADHSLEHRLATMEGAR